MSRESSQRYNASYMDWETDSNSQQGRQRSQSYHERQYLEPDPQESFSKVSIINEREYFKSDNRAAQASSSSSYETQHSEPQKGHFEDDYRASEVSKRQETSFSQQDNGPKLKTLIKQQEGVATKSYGEVTQESSFVAIKMNSDKFKGIVMCGVVKEYIDSYCGLIEVCKIGNQVFSQPATIFFHLSSVRVTNKADPFGPPVGCQVSELQIKLPVGSKVFLRVMELTGEFSVLGAICVWHEQTVDPPANLEDPAVVFFLEKQIQKFMKPPQELVQATVHAFPNEGDPHCSALVWSIKDDDFGFIEIKGGTPDNPYKFYSIFHRDQIWFKDGKCVKDSEVHRDLSLRALVCLDQPVSISARSIVTTSGVHLKPSVFELQAIAVSLDPNQMPIQVPKATMLAEGTGCLGQSSTQTWYFFESGLKSKLNIMLVNYLSRVGKSYPDIHPDCLLVPSKDVKSRPKEEPGFLSLKRPHPNESEKVSAETTNQTLQPLQPSLSIQCGPPRPQPIPLTNAAKTLLNTSGPQHPHVSISTSFVKSVQPFEDTVVFTCPVCKLQTSLKCYSNKKIFNKNYCKGLLRSAQFQVKRLEEAKVKLEKIKMLLAKDVSNTRPDLYCPLCSNRVIWELIAPNLDKPDLNETSDAFIRDTLEFFRSRVSTLQESLNKLSETGGPKDATVKATTSDGPCIATNKSSSDSKASSHSIPFASFRQEPFLNPTYKQALKTNDSLLISNFPTKTEAKQVGSREGPKEMAVLTCTVCNRQTSLNLKYPTTLEGFKENYLRKQLEHAQIQSKNLEEIQYNYLDILENTQRLVKSQANKVQNTNYQCPFCFLPVSLRILAPNLNRPELNESSAKYIRDKLEHFRSQVPKWQECLRLLADTTKVSVKAPTHRPLTSFKGQKLPSSHSSSFKQEPYLNPAFKEALKNQDHFSEPPGYMNHAYHPFIPRPLFSVVPNDAYNSWQIPQQSFAAPSFSKKKWPKRQASKKPTLTANMPSWPTTNDLQQQPCLPVMSKAAMKKARKHAKLETDRQNRDLSRQLSPNQRLMTWQNNRDTKAKTNQDNRATKETMNQDNPASKATTNKDQQPGLPPKSKSAKQRARKKLIADQKLKIQNNLMARKNNQATNAGTALTLTAQETAVQITKKKKRSRVNRKIVNAQKALEGESEPEKKAELKEKIGIKYAIMKQLDVRLATVSDPNQIGNKNGAVAPSNEVAGSTLPSGDKKGTFERLDSFTAKAVELNTPSNATVYSSEQCHKDEQVKSDQQIKLGQFVEEEKVTSHFNYTSDDDEDNPKNRRFNKFAPSN